MTARCDARTTRPVRPSASLEVLTHFRCVGDGVGGSCGGWWTVGDYRPDLGKLPGCHLRCPRCGAPQPDPPEVRLLDVAALRRFCAEEGIAHDVVRRLLGACAYVPPPVA